MTVSPIATTVARTEGTAPDAHGATGPRNSQRDLRFSPGQILARRYRIVSLLGLGGMGEVYRADDMALGVTVALKFLPADYASDPARIETLKAEVRLARGVGHPNVCRVYDIVQDDDRLFLSMEYIDGEDLAGLLRRIGRLPHDKAIQIARQVCLGLAAAHDQGILHRDLKPGNIMIDARGQARIADFGLALSMSEAHRSAGIVAGTPAYMAPEQRAGSPATRSSDLYALGVVLYELFTGKRPFETKDGRRSDQESHHVVPPTTHIADLDPSVEFAILHCLQPDPAARPASAHAVAVALPGVDPVEAALAAGHTPAPDMVAALGRHGGLKPHAAVLCLGVALLALSAVVIAHGRSSVLRLAPLEQPPALLQAKADEALRALGYDQAPIHAVSGFQEDDDLFLHLRARELPLVSDDSLKSGAPSLLHFWHRRSPSFMIDIGDWPRHVSFSTPPLQGAGAARLLLDTRGHLAFFEGVPGQPAQPPDPVDEQTILGLAGWKPDQLQPAEATVTPPYATDERWAWTGTHPSDPSLPIRLEAGAWKGRLTFLYLIAPWTDLSSQEVELDPDSSAEQFLMGLCFLGLACLLLGTAWLALRNLRAGRSDRRAASRLAVAAFLVEFVGVVLADFAQPAAWLASAVSAIMPTLGSAATTWLLYVALEPYVRRVWPHIVVSWTTLLHGRWRDPIVGRDILVGSLLGLVTVAALAADGWSLSTFQRGFERSLPSVASLLGARESVATVIATAVTAVFVAMWSTFILILIRGVVRSRILATILLAFIFLAGLAAWSFLTWNRVGLVIIPLAILGTVCLVRVGLLAFSTMLLVLSLPVALPLTLDLTAWYAVPSWIAIGLLLAMIVISFRISLGGRPVFAKSPLDA